MSDEKALLAAIWENPHEDTPRLVFADWLQENGQAERAEFIRAQCLLARLPDDDPRREKLQRQERHLWQSRGRVFRRGLPDRIRSHKPRRGFIEPVLNRVTDSRFIREYLPILSHAPLWDVTISASSDVLAGFFASEQFRRIGALRIPGLSRLLLSVVASPHKVNLTELTCPYSFATPNDIAAMCVPGAMSHLTKLNLNSGSVGDEGLTILSQSQLATNLTSLALESNKIGAAGVRAMVESENFDKLQYLDLGYDRNGDAIVAALTSRNSLPSLRHLRLFSMGLTDTEVEAIAAWPGAVSLRHLDLHGDVTIRADGIRKLAASPYLRELQTLDLFPWRVQRPEIEVILLNWLGSVGDVPNSTHGLRASRVVRQ